VRWLAIAGQWTLAMLFAAGRAYAADPTEYIYSPVVVEGEHEVDLRAGVGSSGRTTGMRRGLDIGLGAGLTEHWFSEVSMQWRRGRNGGTAFDAAEWENIIALAEPGQWPLDLGVFAGVELPRDPAEGTALRLGLLAQHDLGLWQFNANALASHHVGSSSISALQWRYQAQAMYRWRPALAGGLQAFGQLSSPTQSWAAGSQQSHRLGPFVMGRIPLGERSLTWQLAALAGLAAHAPDRTLRLQVEYDF
jgi:hypothetical protein